MKQVYRLASFLFLLLTVNCVPAQLRDLKFRHIDVNNGLPGSSVNVVVKDSLGYIWIGTRNGLCRYDGFNYTLYQHDSRNGSSLPDNNVISLIVSRDNQLWISTPHGICSYDRSNGQFHALVLPSFAANESHIPAKLFLQDRNGYIWFGEFLNGNLIGFHPQTHDYKKIDFFKHDGAREVNSFYEDAKGSFWISRYRKLYCYQPSNGSFRKIDYVTKPVSPNIITAFAQAADGSMWFTSWGAGLTHVPPNGDPETYLIEPVTQLNGTKNVMNSLAWIGDKHTGKTNLWMMSEYGVVCFDTLSRKFQIYPPSINNPYANRIQFAVSRFPGSFFDASQNMLWCWGPLGIDICDFDKQPIQTFHTLTGPHPVQTGSIDGFINSADNPNEYFISCFARNTLTIYNELLATLEVKKTPASEGIPVIFQPSAGIVWMSSKNDVWEWNRRTDRFTKINALLGMPEASTAGYSVNCYCKNGNGIIWLGTSGHGIGRYDPAAKKCRWLNNQAVGESKPIMPKNISQLTATPNGHLYGLDYAKGLFEITGNASVTTWYPPADALGKKSEDAMPFTFQNMVADKKNGLWLITNKGILFFDAARHTYLPADSTHILPGGMPENMAVDKYGYLWISYADQLAVFDPERRRICSFGLRNGYQGSPDGCSFLINAHNNLLIGYENHIESVVNDPFAKAVYKLPNVLLTHLNNNPDSMGVNLAGASRTINMYYPVNSFEIGYALPLYHHPDDITYSYQLNGYESTWNNAGKTHTAKYTNLPGGNYQFQVKAFDPASGQYSKVTSMAIVVYPPFWKREWFIILVSLFLLGLIYLLYRYRLSQLLRLERMRIAISSDLHDEVGSTLSSISIYSNVARQMAGVDEEESNKYLQRIETSSREMIDSMSDIVWSINPANDDPVKILERMKMHAYEVLGASGVNLHWQEAASLNIRKMKMDVRKNFYLIFKECINNTAKYAAASEVLIDIKTVHNECIFDIRDNGIGFDPALANLTGNGLKNMQTRSRLLKGELKIVSAPGKGTWIHLIFPIG